MKSLTLTSYYELLTRAGKFYNHRQPEAEKHLKDLGFDGIALHAQAPIFYIVDYSRNKYLYIDPSCKTIFDYCLDYLTTFGPMFLSGLWHENDLIIFNKNIFPEQLNFLKQQLASEYPDFSFSFNYRISTKDGKWRTVLQRTTYLTASDDGKPLAAIVFITDISQYKEDSRIIHTVEKIDRSCDTIASLPLFRSIYFPDKGSNVLSKREIEILKLIYEGLSSKKIADKLFVSINTINNHRKNMLEKTKTNNTSELLHYALKKGLLVD